jgi:hypothetical protein
MDIINTYVDLLHETKNNFLKLSDLTAKKFMLKHNFTKKDAWGLIQTIYTEILRGGNYNYIIHDVSNKLTYEKLNLSRIH